MPKEVKNIEVEKGQLKQFPKFNEINGREANS